MTKKLLLHVALLICLGDVVLTEEGKEDSSKEKESSEEEKGTGNGMTTPGPNTANTKAIEKRFLGQFKLTSSLKNDDIEDFLIAMEYKKSDRDRIRNAKDVHFKIGKVERSHYKVQFLLLFIPVQETSFKLGQETDEKLIDGRNFKAINNFEGEDKVVREEKHAGFNCHHLLLLKEKGFTMNMECKGVKATVEFTKEKELKDVFKRKGAKEPKEPKETKDRPGPKERPDPKKGSGFFG